MKRETESWTGDVKGILQHKIYLNVCHLKKGFYELKIINKNKVLKRTTFKKE
jgi:hypothetical protein